MEYSSLKNSEKLNFSKPIISSVSIVFGSVRLYSTMKPEGVILDWDFRKLTPEKIFKDAEKLIDDTKAQYDFVGSLDIESVSYNSVIKPLYAAEIDFGTRSSFLGFVQHCSDSKELRNASYEADKKLENFAVDMSLRKDIFDRLVALVNKVDITALKPEAKRFLERLVKEGRRNGLHLEESQRERIKEMQKRMSDLSLTFGKNLNEDTTKLHFSAEELDGLPDDFLEALDKDEEGKYVVTLQYPHYFPVLRKCKKSETRKILATAYQSKCMNENVPILEELIRIRKEMVDILGYPNYASYIHEMRMAKNPQKVAEFLTSLCDKLQPLWKKEKEELLELKKKECEQYSYPYNGKIDFWDTRYYATIVEETRYSVNKEKLRPYFPMEKVTQGLLKIYEEILGLNFTEEKEADKWHDDATVYRANDSETGELLGYFVLDLFPRDGKYGHAAVFPLVSGCLDPHGNRIVPFCAMLTNFTKPTSDRPSLLDHDEVETYFHEFGHAMHHICSKAEFKKFSGTRVERDFVEAPSQMLENWCWQEEPLKRMSGHYKTGEPLPSDLMATLRASRLANAAGFNLRQIILATFDQKVHTETVTDTEKLFSDLYKTILDVETIPGTNFAGTFNHLASGYPAQYYGYLWSEVFSADMFESKFAKEGVMNPKVGMEYRRKILEPGGSVDADVMIRNFLGRDPTMDAFLRKKGITV
ncbi:hypothetical protein QYM36_017217 [Artemia franciscana]|uniref:Peptidase M3A/M3B catalytic domain-containing protein n=1 Tax=Artemia franciscana TaxID=6661 RepID=A0AA88KWX2_ARTSF|nr:hypothetical protein QYM36_017217 [Artemia franciscana]